LAELELIQLLAAAFERAFARQAGVGGFSNTRGIIDGPAIRFVAAIAQIVMTRISDPIIAERNSLTRAFGLLTEADHIRDRLREVRRMAPPNGVKSLRKK